METEIGGEKVSEEDELKTLGVKFDSCLQFDAHWREIGNKMKKKLYGISQIKSHLTFKQRKNLARTLAVS